jgi:PleD family two-component response regulator
VGLRLLLLDEECERREELARQLARLGYQVTPVCHPRQALEAASFRRFDLMLLPAAVSEFRWDSLVAKLRHLLGSIRFVVIATPASSGSKLRAPDIVSANVTGSDFRELLQLVEQSMDELRAANLRQRRPISEANALVGVS